MSFDDIPEDKQESYPCKCGGNITKNKNGNWECDSCGFCKGTTTDKQSKNSSKKERDDEIQI